MMSEKDSALGELSLLILLGVALAINGAYAMGFVAALAIPKALIDWFTTSASALFTINLVSQFLALGIFAILVGIVLGKVERRLLLSCITCYLSYIFFATVGISLIYDEPIAWPYQGASFDGYHWYVMAIVPVCLFSAAFNAQD